MYYNPNPLLKDNFRNHVTQQECEDFCKDSVGCAGYLYRRPKKNCKGQCHLRTQPPMADKSRGPMHARYDGAGAGYSFYENSEGNFKLILLA